MNDNDVREMFRRRESDVHAPMKLPEVVKRRTRRHQATLSLTAGFVAFAVATGIFLIPRQSRTASPRPPAASQESEVRTATLANYTISYPRDWFLTVSQADYRSPQTVQLSNFDPRFPDARPCADGNSGMPGNGIWLQLESSPGTSGTGPVWPVDLVDGAFPTSCSGRLLTASWLDVGTGISFQAQAVVGPEVSTEDHQRLLDAFSSLQIPDLDHGIQGSFFSADVKDSTSAAVLAASAPHAPAWTLAAHQDDYQPGLVFELGRPQDLGFAGGGSIGGVRIDAPDQIMVDPVILAGKTVLVGAVSLDASRVEVRPDGAQPIDAELATLPPSLAATLQPFTTELDGIPSGTITVYDDNGGVLTQQRFYPGRYTSPQYPGFQMQPDGTIVDAKIYGGIWKLIDTGTSIELSDGTTTLATAPANTASAIAFDTHTFTNGQDSQTIVFGTLSSDITYLIATGAGGPTGGILVPVSGGRLAFWTWTIDQDRLLALNANCGVVAAVDIRSGASTNDSPPAECVPA
jgi:hypothetical protein